MSDRREWVRKKLRSRLQETDQAAKDAANLQEQTEAAKRELVPQAAVNTRTEYDGDSPLPFSDSVFSGLEKQLDFRSQLSPQAESERLWTVDMCLGKDFHMGCEDSYHTHLLEQQQEDETGQNSDILEQSGTEIDLRSILGEEEDCLEGTTAWPQEVCPKGAKGEGGTWDFETSRTTEEDGNKGQEAMSSTAAVAAGEKAPKKSPLLEMHMVKLRMKIFLAKNNL